MQYRRYRSDKQVTTGTTTIQVKCLEVPSGFVLEVTHFACCDLATKNKQLECGYIDAAGTDRIVHSQFGAQITYCETSGRLWIEEGETPYGKVYTPGDLNTFIVSCHGRLWPKELWRAKGAEVQRKSDVSDDSKPQ